MEFLVGIASSIVGEITKYTIAPIGRQVGYLFHYQNNKEKLRVKIEELDSKKESIDTQIEEGRKRGEKTRKEVDKWLEIVKTRSKEANEILKDEDHPKAECSCSGSFPNLVLRHQLSRKMKKMAETIAREIQETDRFQNNITYRPALIKSSFETEDFEVFDTRMPTLREIMKALKDPNCSKIGVYGIGGVGKTTLVKEVARQARDEEEIFTEVVMVTVSQSFDLKSIQKEIAEKLGLPLDKEITTARADQLKHRLKSEKKILIILDDVWEKLELKDVGIYFDKDNQKGCKILLVSRDKHVLCNYMGVEKDIEVGVLLEEEAMKLFNKFVGEKQYFEDLATDIVRRYCGGLPIAIVPIAITLRDRARFVWESALKNLKKCPKEGYESAYPCIKTSYDFLKGQQERQILLLCSLHKEDTNVSVENLMSIYGAYSDMFLDEDTLEDARNSVLKSVDDLQRCCLLLKGDEDGTVKLHDVIRRIMISIAQEQGMWCFEKSDRRSNSGGLDGSTAISLIDHDINQLLKSLACPRLRLLMHEESYSSSDSPAILFPEGFLEEAIELRALCLRSVIVKPLPLLSSSLQNLQTLSLQNCVLEDIAFIGELNNLVVLDLSDSEFEKLPEQIGKLTCLRQLNMNNCTDLKVIPPNVISRLVQLEELYMYRVRINWRTEAVGDMSENASLVEIKNMSRLRALHLCIGDANVLPRGMFVDGKLKRFKIMVGFTEYHYQATSSRLLQLKLQEQSQLHEYGFQMLMKECEELCLGTLQGVNNITSELDADGFVQLKKLFIQENDEVQHIVESTGEIQPCSAFQNLETLELRSLRNIEKICCGSFSSFRVKPFRRLRQITVSKCNKLKNVLPYFVDNRLEKIEIDECNMVKAIVHLESEDHATNCDKIEFPHLRSLVLISLPNLIHFFSSKMETTYCHASSTVTPGVPFFNAKVALPSLEILELCNVYFSNLWPNQLTATSNLQNLTRLNVSDCHKLKYVFPFVIVGGLMQLERLEVIKCSAMEEIIIGAEEERMSSRKISLFPKLKYLELENLESLQSFCDGACIVELESLLEFHIWGCPLLRSFASKARVDQEIGQPLINEKVALPSLEILDLQSMCFSNLWPKQLPTTYTLQSLTRLVVFACHKIKYVFPFVIVEGLMQLERLKVANCSAVEEIIMGVEEERTSSRKISLFPKLKYLELQNLESLQSFCDGACIVELESLLELHLWRCPLLKCFTSKTRVDQEIGQPLINEKVAFPCLKFLKLDETNFSKLWPNQLPTTSTLQNLTRLNVNCCHKLEYVFPLVIVGGLMQLEKLEVTYCSAMEVIIRGVEEEGMSSRKMKLFPKLKYLWLEHLTSLRSFCDGDCNIELESLLELHIQVCPLLKSFTSKTRDEEEIGQPLITEKVAFPSLELLKLDKMYFSELWPNQLPATSTLQNLTSLNVSDCHKLKYPFPFVIVGGLMQLEELEVINCSGMEEIIKGVEEERMSSRKMKLFPKLKYLELQNLKSLQSFCDGDCNVELESLLKLTIRECPLLKSFTSKTRVDEEIGQPLINAKVVFKNLQKLHVENCKSLLCLWDLATFESLQQLKTLQVLGCDLMEEVLVVTKEAGDHERNIMKISFPKLERVKLENLPKLKRFCQGDCTVEFPALLNFFISKCPKRGIDVEDTEMTEVLFNEKVAFPSLEFLNLDETDFSKLWPNQLPATSTLQNLTRLNVNCCHKLEYVFPLVIAGGLMQLEKLEVTNCFAMEVIITGVEGEGMSSKKILFPKLKYLELINLKSLQSFCDGDCNVELESLLELHIWLCPLLKSFTSKTRVDEEIGQPLINEKVAFPSLELLILDETDFSELWPNQLPATSTLQNLTKMNVTCCDKLKYVFPFVIVGGLRQLEELEVNNCSAMEVIITGVEGEGMSSRKMKLFPKLKYLELQNLKSLQSFCDGDCNVELESLLKLTIRECPLLESFTSKTRVDEEIGQPLINVKVVFKNLQELLVENCKSLLCLWDLATFESLQQLKTLQVLGCDFMEEVLVVTKEAGDHERNIMKISFPKLERVKLENLPKLKRFYQGDCTVEFPALLHFLISKCPKRRIEVEDTEMTEVLFNKKVAIPSLKFLKLDETDFSKLWPNQRPATSTLQNLTRLNVSDCCKLKYVFPFVIVGGLMQLERLDVVNCSAMEVIIKGVEEEGMSSKKILFPKLKYLELQNLKSLQSFWDGDCNVELESLLQLHILLCPLLKSFTSKTRVDEEIGQPLINEKVAFPSLKFLKLDETDFSKLWPNQRPATSTLQNLTSLNVSDCHKLKYVFPFVIVGGLMQLERLEVIYCSAMEEIIKGAEEERMSSRKRKLFPKLKHLKLANLESLQSLCDGDCNVELESLLELHILLCPLLKSFTPKTRADEGQPLINAKIGFKTLKRLTIEGCNSLLSLWELATSENIQHLKKLVISGCELMEEILVVTKEAGDQEQKLKKISFRKLENLALKDLPKLKRFCQGECTIEFLSALKLEIQKCTVLRTFIANSTRSTSAIEKVVEEREMAEEVLFDGKVAFYNLERLSVERCENLKYLLTFAIAGKLVQLEKLKVTYCSMMEEMVVVAEDGGERMSSRKILFPKLRSLKLKYLTSLKEICAGDCIIGCESSSASVTSCPLLKTLNEKVAFPICYRDDDESSDEEYELDFSSEDEFPVSTEEDLSD